MLRSLFRPSKDAFAKVGVKSDHRPDGSILLSNRIALDDRDETLIDVLERQARKSPDAFFLKERDGDGWAGIGYADFLARVRRRAGQLLATGAVGHERPLLILAANSIEHAVTMFAAMYAGIPAASVSPAYGMMPGARSRLEKVLGVLNPGAVYLGPPEAFDPALPVLLRACRGAVFSHLAGEGVRSIDDLPEAAEPALASARAAVAADTIAKILFTSGSTGSPKGVINTHRMLCSNQRALAQIWPFLGARPPVLVDWLPWSHTFGGNVCVNATLFHGGVLHIDEGKPAPALIGKTVENLKRVSPTIHFNVPAGIEALTPRLAADPALAKSFFTDLDAVFIAAAALSQDTRDTLSALGEKATGRAPTLLAGWGSTETAPFSTSVYFHSDRADTIGLPMPGTTVKLTPDQDKLALSVKGPNVTPGYWRNSDATKAAFDAEGFYRMGDAGAFIDPVAPEAGLRFDGRLSENFKLTSGTWVNVGMLRVKLVGKLSPYINDVVVTGHNADDIGLLLVPNGEAIAADFEAEAGASLASDGFGAHLVRILNAHNESNPGSSTAIRRAAVLDRAPDIGRNEITDKGYINQRAMLESWSELIEQMYADGPAFDPACGIVRL